MISALCGNGKAAAARAASSAAAIVTSYTYIAVVIMALCEGPVIGINQVWRGQSDYTLAELGLSLFPGTTPQSGGAISPRFIRRRRWPIRARRMSCAANYSLGDTRHAR